MCSTRIGRALRVGVAVCCALILGSATTASAQTFTLSGWTIYTSLTVYPSEFYATYNPGTPRFRWNVDAAHSSGIEMLRCDGSQWSDTMGIPAHDQNYRYFTIGGAYLVVYSGYCEQIAGYSNYGTQTGLGAYLLS